MDTALFKAMGLRPLAVATSRKEKIPCAIMLGKFGGYIGEFSEVGLKNKQRRGKGNEFTLRVLTLDERLRFMNDKTVARGYTIINYPENGSATKPMVVKSREGTILNTTWNTLEGNLAYKRTYSRNDLRATQAYIGYIALWEKQYDTKVLEEYKGNHTKLLYEHLSGEYAGLHGYIVADAIRDMSEPTLRSLTPESRLAYCKHLCEQTGNTFVGTESDKIGVGTNISFKITSGLYGGYTGSTSMSILRRTIAENRSCNTFSLLKGKEQIRFVTEFTEDAGYHIVSLPTPFRVTKKVTITCPNGHEWTPIWDNFLRGARCPHCTLDSRGERCVTAVLKGIGVSFNKQHPVRTGSKRVQFFDFYLPERNLVIEYNGKQHYEPIEFFGGEHGFKLNQARDQAKRDYCKENGITLLELPYTLSDQEVKERIEKALK